MQNFTLDVKPTTISKIKTRETVDMIALNKLLASDLLNKVFNNKILNDIYENEHQQLTKFKDMMNDNATADIKHHKNTAYGRSNPKLGLFLIRRQIRQTLVKNIYVDIDIENCHVVILQQICKMNGIETPMLDDYVINREKHLKNIMDDYDVDRDVAKRVFLVAMYCGNFLIENKKEPTIYKKLIKETRRIAQLVADANPDIVKMVENKNYVNENEYLCNKNGKILAHFLQEIEHQILNEMFIYCVDKKIIVDNNCSLQADGIMIKKENYKKSLLNNLNKHIKKKIGLDIRFTQKIMKDDYLNILDEHIITHKQPEIKKQLPELKYAPDVTGNVKYLSDIFTYEMYEKNDIIVLQSCCGTGKTYAASKYISQSKDKVISIINRKSLLTAQIKEFTDKGIKLNNYEDKETYDLNESGIICINSIMKYSNKPNEHFNQFVIYIDEINSFMETLTHSAILTKDIKIVYETLIRIIKNCKKLIVSDHHITDAVFHLFKSKTNNKKIYVKNNYLKFKGVKSRQIKDELTFKNKMEEIIKSNVGFFAGFDSANCATLYYHNLKEKTHLDCILVTDETRVKIPNNLNDWEGKCIFYSPKIETGVDFNIDTKQHVFYHMCGNSVLPTSSFQMICRTRNMKELTWYAKPNKKHEFKYKSLEEAQEIATTHKQNTNVYMCSSYLNEDDEITYAPNSFYNIYTYNEYVKDIYDNNKQEMLKQILTDNGFVMAEDLAEVPKILKKKVVETMKDVVDVATEETFNQWVNNDVVCEMFDVRSSMLGLKENNDKIKYKEFITDKYKFEDHLKIKLLLKENNYIFGKSKNLIEKSYAEFGINNIFSKIKLLADYERETNISRFDYSNVNNNIDVKTWDMIKKTFRKTTDKPTNDNNVIKEYVSMINNIAKIYDGKRQRLNDKVVRTHVLNKERIKQTFELDFMITDAANLHKNYDDVLINALGFEYPDFNDDEYEILNII